MWTDQSYIIATGGLNTGDIDPMFIVSFGLLGYFIDVEIVEISEMGQSSGSAVEHINYNLWPQKVIRIRINIHGEEIVKEYRISLTFAKIVAKFLGSAVSVVEIVIKTINSIKTKIEAKKL